MKLWFRILATKIMIPIWLICQNDQEFIAVLISSRKLELLSFGYWEKKQKREKDGPCVDDTIILASGDCHTMKKKSLIKKYSEYVIFT